MSTEQSGRVGAPPAEGGQSIDAAIEEFWGLLQGLDVAEINKALTRLRKRAKTAPTLPQIEGHTGAQPCARIYCRGSTAEQIITMKDQAERGKAYFDKTLAGEGVVAFGGIYPDEATTSGRKLTDRRYGAALLRDLKRGDLVVVTHFDRLFRSLSEAAHWIDEWEKKDITVHVIAWHLRGDTPFGRLMLKQIGLMAEFERTLLRERTARAMEHVEKRPGQLRNQKVPPGYRLAGQKGHRRIVPDVDEQKVCARIVEMRDGGMSFDDLYYTLLRGNVLTRAGAKWSRSRIVRAYKAAKKLGKQLTTTEASMSKISHDEVLRALKGYEELERKNCDEADWVALKFGVTPRKAETMIGEARASIAKAEGRQLS